MGIEKRILAASSQRKTKGKFTRPEGAGNFDNMDDNNIVRSINIKFGTVQQVNEAKGVVNREYVDTEVATVTPVDHTDSNDVSNVGTNTHAQVDTHLALTNEHIDWTDATEDLMTRGDIIVTFGGDIILSASNSGISSLELHGFTLAGVGGNTKHFGGPLDSLLGHTFVNTFGTGEFVWSANIQGTTDDRGSASINFVSGNARFGETTVDNLITTQIGVSNDTDLIELGEDFVTINGEVVITGSAFTLGGLGVRVDSIDAAFIEKTSSSRDFVFDTTNALFKIKGDIVFDKISGRGIKVDTVTPTFGFRDIIGDQFAKNTGATKPILTAYNGVINSWKFEVGDEAFITYHIPHDYVAGTPIFLHVHWSHIGTLVTGGNVTFKLTSISAKAHNQAAFNSTPKVGTFTGTASTTQYQQILSEVLYSDGTPTGLEIDTATLEPDSVIELTFEVDANDITVSSGGVPDIFVHYVDIHYQSTNIATKDKAPDFYT